MKTLTYNQNALANHREAHAIVQAVAGSGKTSTITELVIRLIETDKIPAEEIMLVVFGREARKDIYRKLSDKGISPLPKIYTFHSLALRLYNFLGSKGFLNALPLVTSEKRISGMASKVLNATLSQSTKKPAYATKAENKEFLSFIDVVKSASLSASDCFDSLGFKHEYRHFVKAFERFEEERLNKRFVTYSDLMREVVNTCNAYPEAATSIANRLQYLILDEVQDINDISVRLVSITAGHRAKWVMVGDTNQTIFEWRGSDPDFLSYKLKEELQNPSRPDVPIIHYSLPETFRYGHSIALVSNHVISNNIRKGKDLCISSPHAPSSDVKVNFYDDTERFGPAVVTAIKKEAEQGRSFRDIAILVRLHSFTSEVELELLKQGIPYKLESSRSILEQKEAVGLLTVLELHQGAFFTRGDKDAADRLNQLFQLCFFGIKMETNASNIEFFRHNRGELSRFILSYDSPQLSKYKRGKLQDFASALRVADAEKKTALKPADILNTFVKGIELEKTIELFAVREEDAINQMYIINALISFVSKLAKDTHTALAEFAKYAGNKQDEVSGVVIATSHGSKGREWPVVIIPGLEEGLFPYTHHDGRTDIESERRLFYVTSTRAQNKLIYIALSDAELEAQLSHKSEHTPADPKASRFLFEAKIRSSTSAAKSIEANENITNSNTASRISKEYCKRLIEIRERNNSNISGERTTSPVSAKYEDINIDSRIKHAIFGVGIVLACESNRLTVDFDDHGVKTLNPEAEVVEII